MAHASEDTRRPNLAAGFTTRFGEAELAAVKRFAARSAVSPSALVRAVVVDFIEGVDGVAVPAAGAAAIGGGPKGRPSRLAARFTVRFTEGEIATLKQRAATLGIRPSALVRAVTIDAMARGDAPMVPTKIAAVVADAGMREMAALRTEINRVGVNLRQLIRRYRTRSDLIMGAEAAGEIAAIQDLVESLQTVSTSTVKAVADFVDVAAHRHAINAAARRFNDMVRGVNAGSVTVLGADEGEMLSDLRVALESAQAGAA